MNAIVASTVHEETMLSATMKINLVGNDDGPDSGKRQLNINYWRRPGQLASQDSHHWVGTSLC